MANEIKTLNELAELSSTQQRVIEEDPTEKQIKNMREISLRNEKVFANMEKKTTDKIIDIAEMELERSGVTLYGHNGPINLTPLEHKFSVGYVKSGSVVEAIRFTGFKGHKTKAQTLGYQLFNNPKVAEAIAVIEKQHVLASGLTEVEIIAGIRDVAMLARQKGAFTAALKGYAMLGDYLGMWEESKQKKKAARNGEANSTQHISLHGDIFINNNSSSGGGGDKKDMINEVQAFGEILGFKSDVKIRPEILKDITASAIISEDALPSSKQELEAEYINATEEV